MDELLTGYSASSYERVVQEVGASACARRAGLRGVAWRLLLGVVPGGSPSSAWADGVRAERARYEALKLKHMPDIAQLSGGDGDPLSMFGGAAPAPGGAGGGRARDLGAGRLGEPRDERVAAGGGGLLELVARPRRAQARAPRQPGHDDEAGDARHGGEAEEAPHPLQQLGECSKSTCSTPSMP